MKVFVRRLSYIMAAVGAAIMFGAISTSDYYMLELREPEPSYIWPKIMIGCVLVLPVIIYSVVRKIHGR